MTEKLRNALSRVREFVGKQSRATRHPVKVGVRISLAKDAPTNSVSRAPQALVGYTNDLSLSGIAFIVPAIRIGSNYIAGDASALRVTLELPSMTLRFNAVPVRYHQLETRDDADKKYLIGARITEIDEETSKRLKDYLNKHRRKAA